MKQKHLNKLRGLIVALSLLMGASAEAQTTLASWTFDTGYDVESNVYTPNTSDWAQIGWNGFSTLPQIRPNTFTGTQSNYYASAKGTRFWGIMHNELSGTSYGKYLGLYQDQDPNNITDYTDASQHNQYFEFSFPTTGYKDVNLTFAFTCNDNVAHKLELVYSTDNGTTWVDAGGFAGATGWWFYNESNVSLTATNKSKVIVRLIAENEVTAQWRMNRLSITGTAASSFAEMYTLTTSASPAGAGSITRSPAAAEYEENTAVSLTATPNVGYAFKEWQDGSGTTLSTENPYNITITSNTNIVAVFKKAPLPAGTTVTLAEWNFNTGYDVSGTVYTPNDASEPGSATADAIWFNTGIPQILPNNSAGIQTDYYMSGTTARYWYLKQHWYNSDTNYGPYMFQITNDTESNNITDFTDGSQHANYFEISFPTINYEDINVGFKFAYSSNTAVDAVVVASTDGGSTWTKLETITTTGAWYTYITKSYDLTGADNKNNVKVRIIAGNGVQGSWCIDDVTVTGKVMARSVKVTDAGYATYYNDCAVEIPAGLTAYWGKLSNDGTKLEMTEITDGIIPAETAVLVKGAANTYALTATAEVGGSYAENALRGVVAETSVSSLSLGSGTVYVLAKAKSTGNAAFCQFTGTTLGDHRAFLFVADSTAPMIDFDFGGTTGINEVNESVASQSEFKVNGEYYNLAGQRVAQPTKGLYIVNGRKVVIK